MINVLGQEDGDFPEPDDELTRPLVGDEIPPLLVLDEPLKPNANSEPVMNEEPDKDFNTPDMPQTNVEMESPADLIDETEYLTKPRYVYHRKEGMKGNLIENIMFRIIN